MSEPRSIWCVTKDGVPVDWCWALAARPDEVDPVLAAGKTPGWIRSALTPEQAADPAYDAVRVEWRDHPRALTTPMMSRGSPVLEAVAGKRAIRCHGFRYYLDDRGRTVPGKGEPEAPHTEIADEAEAVAFVAAVRAERVAQLDARNQEEHGVPLPEKKRARLLSEPWDVVERGTGKRVRVVPVRQDGQKDEDIAALHPADCDLIAPDGAAGVKRLAAKGPPAAPTAPPSHASAGDTKAALDGMFPERAAVNAVVQERDALAAEVARLRAALGAKE